MVVRTIPKRATWISGYAEMLGMGMISGAFGPLLAMQVPYFRLNLSQAGLPVAFEGAGYLLGTLVVPFIWAISRARWILLGSYLAVILLLASVFFRHDRFNEYLIQVLLLGAFSGVIIVAVDAYLSDAHRPFQAPYLNLSHLFFGLGAFFGPMIVAAVLLWIGQWHYYFLILTLLFIAFFPFMWLEALKPDKNFVEEPASLHKDDPGENPFRSLVFWLINLGMFFSLGLEFGLATWQPLFLIRVRGLSPSTASICVSFFWLSMMAGRFIYLRYLPNHDLIKSVLAATVLSAGCMLLVFTLKRPCIIMLLTVGTGLGMSILYPNLLALGTNKYAGKTGMITGVLSFGSGVGSIVLPWLLGPISQTWGLAGSIYILPLCGFALTLLVTWIWFIEARAKAVSPATESR